MRQLKIYWIPQVPMKSFDIPVRNLREGKLLLDVLADYDAFQFENNIKPDYSNTGGLMVLADDGEWEDWYDDNGDSVETLTDEQIDFYDLQQEVEDAKENAN